MIKIYKFIFILSSLLVLLYLISHYKNSITKSSINGIKTYYPKEINDVLSNPYIGWSPPANGGPYSQPHKLVYAMITWAELEPTKDNFNFTEIERKYKFDYWSKKDTKIILRIVLDLPDKSKHKDIPEFLYNEINGDGTWYDDLRIGRGFSPNYSNNILLLNHERMIKSLGNKYNNDKRIAFVILGSLGHWGEWHTWPYDTNTGIFPYQDISNQYVKHYLDAFSNKICMIRRPFDIAKKNNIGLYNDMFGNKLHTDTWLNWINNGYTDDLSQNHPSMNNFWKLAPCGGEFASGNPELFLINESISETINQAKATHVSWLGPCCPAYLPFGKRYQSNIDMLHKKIGYRFVVESISHSNNANVGDNLLISMTWHNKGVAPFYYEWPIELSLSNSTGKIVAKDKCLADLRTFLPGKKQLIEDFIIPNNLSSGKYTLCVAILDPSTNNPGISLAIEGKRLDGRYSLSKIKVYNNK